MKNEELVSVLFCDVHRILINLSELMIEEQVSKAEVIDLLHFIASQIDAMRCTYQYFNSKNITIN